MGTSDRIYKNEIVIEELVTKPSRSHELLRDFKKSYFTKDKVEHFAKEICKKE